MPAETTPLIWLLEAKYRGKALPAIKAVAPASVVLSGIALAEAVPLARSSPYKEMSDPGASGVVAAAPAAITAASSVGPFEESPSPPVTSRVPDRLRAGSVAVKVRVTGPDLCPDIQVACHNPPACNQCKLIAGSPLENETATFPLSRALPQLSRTTASKATGHAAGTPKDCPRVVMAGTSCVGIQPFGFCVVSEEAVDPGVADG